jgi:hypothetical protein
MWPKVAGSDQSEFDVTVGENCSIYLSSVPKKSITYKAYPPHDVILWSTFSSVPLKYATCNSVLCQPVVYGLAASLVFLQLLYWYAGFGVFIEPFTLYLWSLMGLAVAQLVEALFYKLQGLRFDS